MQLAVIAFWSHLGSMMCIQWLSTFCPHPLRTTRASCRAPAGPVTINVPAETPVTDAIQDSGRGRVPFRQGSRPYPCTKPPDATCNARLPCQSPVDRSVHDLLGPRIARHGPRRELPRSTCEHAIDAVASISELCGGEGGIRTPGRSPFNGFQDRRFKPLSHLSRVNAR